MNSPIPFKAAPSTPCFAHPARCLVLLSSLAALSGCTSITPNFDEHFGKSVTTYRLAQTKDPRASITNADKSVDVMDARAAREAIYRYYSGFEKPAPPVNVFNIGVGAEQQR